MHADLPQRDKVAKDFCLPNFIDLPAPATVKVYFPLTDLDTATGPPVFVPGSHLLYSTHDVPEGDPPGSQHAFCLAGSAIVMDLRVLHHGTPNNSQRARPMISLHYAAPWYNE